MLCFVCFRYFWELSGPPSPYPPQRDPSSGPLPANPQPGAAEGGVSTSNLLVGTRPGRASCQPENSPLRKSIFVPVGMTLEKLKLIIINSKERKEKEKKISEMRKNPNFFSYLLCYWYLHIDTLKWENCDCSALIFIIFTETAIYCSAVPIMDLIHVSWTTFIN